MVALLFVLFVVVPALSLIGEYTGIVIIEPHNVTRLGRFLCFAIAALGIDMIWGYAGVLSLCHALFFCLGGYAIAMHLSLPEGGGDVRPEYNNIPQFFFFNSVDTLPSWWGPFASFPFALMVAVAVPMLLSGLFAFFIFRNRVRGVYFSIITQALAWGGFLAFSRNEMLLGGTNGLTNFYKPFTSKLSWVLSLYLLTAVVLVACFWICRRLVISRFGRAMIAIRDNEPRLYFLGYRADVFKAFAFVVAALLAAVGGMLYVPQNGIMTPNAMRVEDSIWMVVWVAVGGRGTLWGAAAGALVAMYTYSSLTSDMPNTWPIIQGSLFLAVLAFPGGIGDLWKKLEAEMKAGAGVFRAVVALILVEAFLIVDKLGYLKNFLSTITLGGVSARYAIPIVIVIALCWGRSVARASVPLLVLTWFILTEALGLMPGAFSVLKYVLISAAIIWYAFKEGGLGAKLKARFGGPRAADATAGTT